MSETHTACVTVDTLWRANLPEPACSSLKVAKTGAFQRLERLSGLPRNLIALICDKKWQRLPVAVTESNLYLLRAQTVVGLFRG